MKWTAAANLHNEDEVIVKRTGEAMDVVEVEINKSAHSVEVMLTDGNWYNHTEIE
jgi:hypothetical protein